jgi:hypothetical protein
MGLARVSPAARRSRQHRIAVAGRHEPGEPKPERWAHQEDATMAELSTTKRKSLPKSKYGLPEAMKYPMPDRSHARNAKARASQQEKKGTLTARDKARIDRRADRILDN